MSHDPHVEGKSCQHCAVIASVYTSTLYKDGSVVDETRFTQPLIQDQIEFKQSDSSCMNFFTYTKNLLLCMFAFIFGFLTFGFFKDFNKPKFFLRYLSFIASFGFTMFCMFGETAENIDIKVTGLIFFIMMFSILVQSLILLSKKIYMNEKSDKPILNKITGKPLKDEDNNDMEQPFLEYYVDNELKLTKNDNRKNQFLVFFSKMQNPMIKSQLDHRQNDVTSPFMKKVKRIIEGILFNSVVLLGLILGGGSEKPLTYVQIVLFQIYFTYNILFHTNEEILYQKEAKLKAIKGLTANFKSENKSILEKQPEKMQVSKQTELLENMERILNLTFKTFKHTREIAASTSTIYVITVFAMGIFLTCDNLLLNYHFKKDFEFMCLYVTYMVFLSSNVAIILLKKLEINKNYVKILSDVSVHVIEPLEKKITQGAVKKDEFKKYKEQNQQQQDNLKDQQNQNNYEQDQLIDDLATGIHVKGTMEKLVKKHCERLLYSLKVNSKLLVKFFFIFAVLIYTSLMSA